MNDVDWNALVTRSGTRPPQPAADGDALRSVQRVLPRLSGTSLDADISLALLTAASNGTWSESARAWTTPASSSVMGLVPMALYGPVVKTTSLPVD